MDDYPDGEVWTVRLFVMAVLLAVIITLLTRG